MALNSTAVGEVRPGLGSDTNGGFYDSSIGVSTDYSQRNDLDSKFSTVVFDISAGLLTPVPV